MFLRRPTVGLFLNDACVREVNIGFIKAFMREGGGKLVVWGGQYVEEPHRSIPSEERASDVYHDLELVQ